MPLLPMYVDEKDYRRRMRENGSIGKEIAKKSGKDFPLALV